MPVLNEAQRAAVWSELMNELSGDRDTLAVTKAELRAAIDAADTWVNTQQSAYNLALPTAFRTKGTNAQKARLLMFVVRKRFIEGA